MLMVAYPVVGDSWDEECRCLSRVRFSSCTRVGQDSSERRDIRTQANCRNEMAGAMFAGDD